MKVPLIGWFVFELPGSSTTTKSHFETHINLLNENMTTHCKIIVVSESERERDAYRVFKDDSKK